MTPEPTNEDLKSISVVDIDFIKRTEHYKALDPEGKRKLDMLLLRAKSGALSFKEQCIISEGAAMTYVVDDRIPCKERIHLSYLLAKMIRANAKAALMDDMLKVFSEKPANTREGFVSFLATFGELACDYAQLEHRRLVVEVDAVLTRNPKADK